MSTSYNNNQSWGQQQGTFAQPHQPQQMKDFDFTAMSGTVDDIQPQNAYATYHPSQLQLSSSSGPSSSMMPSNFSTSQPQSRSGSFGTAASAPQPFDAFNSNPNHTQNLEPYNPIFSNPSSEQLSWDGTSSFSYNKPIPNTNFSGSTFHGTAESTYLAPHLSSSPSAMEDAFSRSSSNTLAPPSHYSSAPTPTVSDPRAKRPRNQTRDDSGGDELDNGTTSDAKETAKAKSGACSRCKNLKVKCEFKTDTDPCKRCLNGGHDCIIPGRKKRRTPPKREHLLNQIREQAAQIKDLMTQLETDGNRQRRQSSVASDSFASSSAQSPLLSPTTTHTSFISSDAPSSTSDADSAANKAVEDWIAKAKQSFEEFDVFIGIGGAGMPKSYLIHQDLENPDSDDDDDYVNVSGGESDYEFAIEHHDGEEVSKDQDTLRHRSSSSSLSTNGTGVPSLSRKKHNGESSKPAILPGGAAPFGLFGDLSLKTPKKRRSDAETEEDDKAPGIANTNFFRSTPAPEALDKRLANFSHPPPILTRGIITPKEAEELFQIYFERMNLSVSLLDPVLYTAQRTCYRSPFLFTVICAIASRYYSERPGLYPQVIHYAQQAAGMALIGGHKNVEMCQAYILLSLYPVPAKRWEDQRSWLYLGLAIRTATDLNLHLPNTAKPLNENHAREMLNRTRVWLNCFNLDRSTSSQYGKPPIISNADYMANHSEDWWKSSPFNMQNFDIQICAYNAELKVMAGFISKIYSDPHHPTGLNKEVDFEKIATETDDELKQLAAKWMAILETTDMTDPQNRFRTGLLRIAYPYARLIALSYGFQHAFGKNYTDENPFLTRCLQAAFDVVIPVLENLCPPGHRVYLRHGPEAQSVFITFASAFLVKLLQPKFASYLTIEKRLEIREVVQRVVDLLASEEVAIDDRHGPKLYAKFLKGLLAAPMARVDPISPTGLPRKGRVSSTNSHTSEPAVDAHISPIDRASRGSASLSPAPRQEALSFDSFAPIGATDPYAPAGAVNSLGIHIGNDGGVNMLSDFFQPPLPFDEAILHSMQSLSDPTVWHDTTLPSNFTWDTFSSNFEMDYKTQDPVMYSDYMPGVQR